MHVSLNSQVWGEVRVGDGMWGQRDPLAVKRTSRQAG